MDEVTEAICFLYGYCKHLETELDKQKVTYDEWGRPIGAEL